MERVEYLVGEFTDFTGMDRQFVLAAVTINGGFEVFEDSMGWEDESVVGSKALSIGISVCRPTDEFNEEVGKSIAKGKAIANRDHCIYSSSNGMINGKMVRALLEQEADFFKQNPGNYIKGYNAEKEKYEEGMAMVEAQLSLSEKEQEVLDFLLSASDQTLDTIFDIFNYNSRQ